MKLLLFLLFGIVFCYGLPSLGGYQSIDTVEAQSSDKIKSLIDVGLQQLIEDGLQKGSFTSTNFVLAKINSIYRQIDNGENYKFNCQFDNDEDIVMTASFEVHYDTSTSTNITSTSTSTTTKTVTTFSYQVTKRSVVQTVETSYKQLTDTEVQYSQEIQNVLNYGVAQVVEQSVKEGSLPDLSFEIKQVNSVFRQLVDSALFYKCNVNIESEEGIVVEVTFTVYYQPISTSTSVVDYSCKVRGDGEAEETEFAVTTEIIGPAEDQYSPVAVGEMQNDRVVKNVLDFGCEQVNKIAVEEKKITSIKLELEEVLEAYSQVVGNGLFYKFTCKLGDRNSVTVIATFTVHYQVNTQEKSLTECSYETQYIETNTEEDNETEVEINIETPDETDEVDVESVLPEEEQIITSEEDIEEEIIKNSALDFGVDTIIKQGIKDGKIPDAEFSVSNIISSSKESTDKGSLYKFSCELTNQNGSIFITMKFTVYYQLSSQRKTLSSYSYRVSMTQTTTPITPVKPIDGEYTVCGEEEIKTDTVIQTVLDYGTSQIYMLGLLDGKLPLSNFSIVTVVNVWKQVTVYGSSYKCEVVMENENKVTVNAKFTVSYQSATNETALSEYYYTVYESEAPINDGNTTTTNATEPTSSDSYVELKSSEIESSAEVQDVLAYGVDYIIQKGYEKDKIPRSEYKITKVVSVSRKTQTSKNLYKCSVELQDVNKVLITAKFTISIKSSNQDKYISSWSYHVSNIKTSSTSTKPVNTAYTEVNKTEAENSAEIQDCINFAIKQVIKKSEQYTTTVINSVFRQVVESTLYYKFDVELSNENGKTAKLACTVSYKPDIDLKDIKAYSYKIRTVRTTSTSSSSSQTSTSTSSSNSYSYTKLELSTVETDSKYQNLLDYGVKECVQKLNDYNVVVTADFQISQVLSAFTQQTTNGENCKFKARLTNSRGISLDVNINVNYDASTDSKALTSYSVEGSSEGQSDVMIVNSSNNDEEDLEIGNCEKVASQEVDTSSEVQGAINYGLDNIVTDIISNEKIETDDFEVKEVKNVYKEVVNSQNYRVEATLVNSAGTNIDCSFSVNYQSSLNVKKVVSYSYIVY